ncbi:MULTISPECIES: multiheme c-type cytochrome [unclassified Agarivorans]|uniref:multiheme c-type cytochrome n=1 Tax=unclassified Agarivorans TaxID=2636026 RepID=UPI0026E16BC3|nr:MULTISPECIES: multiheme c-type cytochrome [unclassified Agarivorans]MDO6686491.1 multiheme c-type cytochrome [Agarivorans sp. 3_MG-2023]MDO6715309.1 multiheme c-type cytochrome [Agarivorans sp. 2_MG-2023]
MMCSALFAAEWVGTSSCISCHQDQYQQWQGSDHDMAMRHANEDAVLGNFADARLSFAGKSMRFFRKAEQYWVTIEGPNGQLQDYKISYTFGYYPLQQYMVEFADGRVQLIPYAWDSRPVEQGGQRWFHLYPKMQKTDEFYWTNAGQSWNYMCADCHSSQLQKGYDISSNTYNTTWFEINVGCEACHGPASEHLKWAQQVELNPQHSAQQSGFDRSLQQEVSEWVYQEGLSTLQAGKRQASQQVKVCAQCHSRRIQISQANNHVTGSLLDRYQPSLISADLYHDDGQIYDEVYVWGSFKQSKMHQAGVSCSNCHNPHTTELKMDEQALCMQCHIAAEYSEDKHSFHAAGTDAAKCTTCHMPATTYMQVDPRRDHSWQIPRPDLSQSTGVPNVCTICHTDKNAVWAEQKLRQWFPDSASTQEQHFAKAFYLADQGLRSAEQALASIAQDRHQSPIIRASAVQRLAGFPGSKGVIAIANAVTSENSLARLGAVHATEHYPAAERWRLLEPLLSDATLAVRSQAAVALVKDWQGLSIVQQQQLQGPLEEYIAIQQYNADRGFALSNLAGVYLAQGQFKKAEQLYLQAIELEPYFANSYVNLADMYRATQQEEKAFAMLAQGIKGQPKSAALLYSAGLSLLRQKQVAQASQYFLLAIEREPSNSHFWYVYGLSLESLDISKAQQALSWAYDTSRNPQHLYALCEMKVRHKDAKAKLCILQLQALAPPDVIKRLNLELNRQ